MTARDGAVVDADVIVGGASDRDPPGCGEGAVLEALSNQDSEDPVLPVWVRHLMTTIRICVSAGTSKLDAGRPSCSSREDLRGQTVPIAGRDADRDTWHDLR